MTSMKRWSGCCRRQHTLTQTQISSSVTTLPIFTYAMTNQCSLTFANSLTSELLQLLGARIVAHRALASSSGHSLMIQDKLTNMNFKTFTTSLNLWSISLVSPMLPNFSMTMKGQASTQKHAILACTGTITNSVDAFIILIQTYLRCQSIVATVPLPGSWSGSSVSAMIKLINSAVSRMLTWMIPGVHSKLPSTDLIWFKRQMNHLRFLSPWFTPTRTRSTRSKAETL